MPWLSTRNGHVQPRSGQAHSGRASRRAFCRATVLNRVCGDMMWLTSPPSSRCLPSRGRRRAGARIDVQLEEVNRRNRASGQPADGAHDRGDAASRRFHAAHADAQQMLPAVT